jgi:hypothetical protein
MPAVFGSIVKIALLIFVILLANAPARAEDQKETPTSDPIERKVENAPSSDGFFIETNRMISKEIDSFAEKIDLYFADREFVDEDNKTRIVIHNDFNWPENSNVRYSPRLGIRLHLPNLQRKWQLKITTYDEDSEERGINKNRYQASSQEENYGTSFALVEYLGNIKTEFRPRVEFTDSLKTSYILKFSGDAKFLYLKLEPEVQLFARSDTGTGEYSALNFVYDLDELNVMTLINEQQYTNGNNTFSTNHGLRLEHSYNQRMAHEYKVVFQSDNRDTYHLEKTMLTCAFKHKLYMNVFHYSITPYLAFEKARKFRVSPGINLKTEVIF